jgi:hypothetical protein
LYLNETTITCHGPPAGFMAHIVHVSAANQIKYVAAGRKGWVVLYAADARPGEAIPNALVESQESAAAGRSLERVDEYR